jgi:UDP-N-acetylmuramoyl-tripeptide--D-alanyl-D-alanine ligase
MIKYLLSMYSPRYPQVLTYMLQSCEYQAGAYVKWLNRTRNFGTVIQRRVLERTHAAKLLLRLLRFGMAIQILLGLLLIILGIRHTIVGGIYFGLAIIVCYPLVWAYGVVVPLLLGRWFVILPKERQLIAKSEKIFAAHPGQKIAVAGSYGKTTMKELLLTVLSEGKKVAATPANRNVAISHAYFANKLTGHEDIVIIEYGEGQPGDVIRFAKTTHPTQAVITGLAPAHLDHYKSVDAAGNDIFSVADYLDGKNVYVDDASPSIAPFIKSSYQVFNEHGALGWKVKNAAISLEGTEATLEKGSESLKLRSKLIGRHQLSFLSFVAAFALELGLTKAQVEAGIAKTIPFEHRMQPYALSGAWIIDDTYNGNLEGIRAGTSLLKELEASRKVYVTPGLVDQGKEARRVHIEMGELIAASDANLVVLMGNSATKYIQQGLNNAHFAGEVMIEYNPLEFYTNLKHFVAAGDLILMQNDWTDNYA